MSKEFNGCPNHEFSANLGDFNSRHQSDLQIVDSLSRKESSALVPENIVISPTQTVDGLSQAQWGDLWWKTSHETPADANPWTTDNEFDLIGNVQMLVGVLPPHGRTREVTVSEQDYLFMPIVNQGADPVGFANYWNAEDSKTFAKAIIDTIDTDSLFLKVDGISLIEGDEWKDYRRSSSSCGYSFTIPEDHFGGYDTTKRKVEDGVLYPGWSAGDVVNGAMSDGYWVMLAPLSEGRHTINFGGTFDYRKIDWDQNDNGKIDKGAEELLEQFYTFFNSPDSKYVPEPLDITYRVTVV